MDADTMIKNFVQKSKKGLENNYLVLIVALCISFVYISHHIFIPHFLPIGTVYLPVTFDATYDEAMYYGPRANAVYHGQWRVGDIHLKKNENSPSMLPLLNPLTTGVLARITGSLQSAFIFSDALFPFVIFLLLYSLTYRLTKRQLPALLFATIFILSPKLFLFIPPHSIGTFKELLGRLVPLFGQQGGLYFSRLEYPRVTFPFYLTALYFIFIAIDTQKRLYAVIAGISFGLLFYVYLFDWAYITVGLCFMGLLFVLQKKFHLLKIIGTLFGVGLLTSVFYWINLLQLRSLSYFNDIPDRFGIEHSRLIRWITWKSYLRNIVLSAMLWKCNIHKASIRTVYIIGLLLPIVVVYNVQVIFGFNPQPDHWFRVQFLPIALALTIIILWFYDKYKTKRSSNSIKKIVFLYLVFFLGTHLYMQYVWSEQVAQKFSMPQDRFEAYQWLNNHTEKNSVVGSISQRTNAEIALLTHNKLFLPAGHNSIASNEEIAERFAYMVAFYNIDDAVFSRLFEEEIRYLFEATYRDSSHNTYILSNAVYKIPTEVKAEKKHLYEKIRKSLTSGENVPYAIDYIWVGPFEKESGFSTCPQSSLRLKVPASWSPNVKNSSGTRNCEHNISESSFFSTRNRVYQDTTITIYKVPTSDNSILKR